MKDFLKEICAEKNMKLRYTEGDTVILSAGIENNTPVIRVNRIFEYCLKEVAKAIIEFYTNFEHSDKYLRLLEKYAGDNLITMDYKILPPDKEFINLMNKDVEQNVITIKQEKKSKEPKILKESKAANDEDATSFNELDISSITKKDFWGNICQIEPGDMIKTMSEDVVELDIVVNHY